MMIDTLVEDEFRAVEVAAGASVSVALGLRGELRVWGSFRVSGDITFRLDTLFEIDYTCSHQMGC